MPYMDPIGYACCQFGYFFRKIFFFQPTNPLFGNSGVPNPSLLEVCGGFQSSSWRPFWESKGKRLGVGPDPLAAQLVEHPNLTGWWFGALWLGNPIGIQTTGPKNPPMNHD